MEYKLKPCPFCRSNAKTWKQGLIRKQLVSCSDDGCGAFFTKFTVEEWNTRATSCSEREAELVDALESMEHFTGDLWPQNETVNIMNEVAKQALSNYNKSKEK